VWVADSFRGRLGFKVASLNGLDQIDRQIINLLQGDARASYQKIGKALGLSPSTARRRVERLLETDTLRLVAVPSWPKLGYNLTALVALSVELNRLKEVGERLRGMDEICFIAFTTGGFDLVAQLVLPANEDYVDFVTERIAPIEGVRSLQTFLIPGFIKSFEQYRLPVDPNPLYAREE
jgi:Lrp/AsnC family transcriptional regulator, regulator for asnA, asnC and gidA